MQTSTLSFHADESRQLLSAVLDGDASAQSLAPLGADPGQALSTWAAYVAIGEALRGQALPAADPAFVSGVMARIAHESIAPVAASRSPIVGPAPVSALPRREAANDSLWRWKAVAGVATLMAVGTLAWQVVVAPAPQAGPQWAGWTAPEQQVVAAAQPVQTVATQHGLLLRDPQLQELMAAHRQYGGVSALQMPAGFLRNATYDVPQR